MDKVVNGVVVQMTPEEVAVRLAEEAAWYSLHPHPPTDDEVDQDTLNRSLAENGSFNRAIAEVLFGVIKGTIPINPNTTKAQYIALLKSRIRT